jgi:hypothetical protein
MYRLTHTRVTLVALLGSSILALAGCGGQHAPVHNAGTAGDGRGHGRGYGPSHGYGAPDEESAQAAPRSAYGEPAPAPASPAGGALASREAEMNKADESGRPGLGTSWGESVSSQVTSTHFVREHDDSPFATATFFYNDERGAEAMTRSRYLEWSDSVTPVAHGITVSVTDPRGEPLRAAQVGGRKVAVGRDGDRYVIRVENHSPVRVEAVATVDGLDVIDGDDGDPSKRGYVVAPYDSLEIEGFRESEGNVRAFRFGATDDSYASRRGKGRNVGVIGVALFEEQGSAWRWRPDTPYEPHEIEERDSADPFPGRFAPAPPAPSGPNVRTYE